MPRENTELPSDDVGWHFATPVDGSRHTIMCKLCGKVIKGGITRLKQHLAHMKGQVAGCPMVSGAVRETMMKHLLTTNEKKKDKQKRREELEFQIRGDDLSDDDEERAMRMAQKESMRSQHEWEERQRFRARTGGGSNVYEQGTDSRPGRHRVGTRGQIDTGGSGRQWINPEDPDAKLRAMDPTLERSKSAKQPKIKTGLMKTLRKKLGTAVGKFFIHNRIPMNVANSAFMQPLIDVAAEVGKGVKAPTPYELSEVYLQQEYEEIKGFIASFAGIWKERGVTIMCDGWTGQLEAT